MPDDLSNCLNAMTDPDTALDRFALAASCGSALKLYNANRIALENCTPATLADRAYEAEANYRVILKAAIDSINELRDSGDTAQFRANAPYEPGALLPLGDAILGAKNFFASDARFNGIDISFLDDAASMVARYGLAVTWTQRGIAANFRDATGQNHAHDIDMLPRPGGLARLGSREFFAGNDKGVFAPLTPSIGDASRHDARQGQRGDKPLAFYDTLMGGFALARETMYRHARVVQRFGKPHIRGNDPLVVIFFAGMAIAAALEIGGTLLEIGCKFKLWSGKICDWAWLLILGGIAVGALTICVTGAAGACEVAFGEMPIYTFPAHTIIV